jgi:hypothetical protein
MAAVALQALRSEVLLVIACGAALITAALLVPHGGLVLAFGLVAASIGFYGDQVRGAARAALPAENDIATAPRFPAPGRIALAVAAALVLVAPVVVRNHGHVLPPSYTRPTDRWLATVALFGWLVVPVALLAAHAEDGHGPLPLRLALGALARHPLATLAALLLVPLALLLTEGVAALVAWQQEQLPLLVVDLFPPPRWAYRVDGEYLLFDYDGVTFDRNYSESIPALATVYPHGFRHGFTLVGTIPPSLATGLFQVRTDPWTYRVTAAAYLTLRVVMTFVILSVAGVASLVQARWLGLVAALGARRPHAAAETQTPSAA